MGDARLREAVVGMSEPTADQHEFYIDVQPVSIRGEIGRQNFKIKTTP